ncbi:rhomboid family intramembrane serine protease [Halobacillus campisalis]|uniref:Rhomboid family intramembrane serine protease n=1 Tax=Halobacillus campisalis TaxID=435909 RepID=A0ABW2K3N1_9BACI|nr:rhomboid family intramembrane serine protease [Halobacillus campisalis]
MYIKQEYFLWKLSYHLVANHQFHILYMNKEKSEIWLEKEDKGKWHVVRLIHEVFNWKNQLKRDIDYVQAQIKQNSQLFRGGKMDLHYVYVSEFPPVDEWESLDIATNRNIQKVNIFYLDDKEKESDGGRLYETLQVERPVFPDHLDEVEYESQSLYLKQQLHTLRKKKQKENEQIFSQGKLFFTIILLVVNFIIFGLMEWQGDSTSVLTLIEYGAKFNPAIIEGEWWRIVSSMFLHIGAVHLLMNMLALFYLGTAVERIYGSIRFIFIYFLAGVFGGLASFMMNPQVAAGASGAIFGLFGALLYFGLKNRRLFFQTMGYNLLIIIGINIAFGIVVPQVDNSAHLGGLVGGFIASMITALPRIPGKSSRLAGVLIYIALVSLMAAIGIRNDEGGDYAAAQLQISQELIQQEEYDRAIEVTTTAVTNPDEYEAELLFNRSYAYSRVDELAFAKADLERVVELQPGMAEAHYNLALIHQTEEELNEARTHAAEAARLQPDNENFQDLSDELNNIE